MDSIRLMTVCGRFRFMAMKVLRATTAAMTWVVLSVPIQGDATALSCASGWTSNPVHFESVIQYADMQSKSNPTVHVLINGRAAKMLLDTGSNINVLWEASLLDETPSGDVHRLEAHVASADSKTAMAALADERGNVLRQEFHVVSHSALAADGYSGIVSPQAIAHDWAVVIDFERNCVFVSPPFDIRSVNGFDVRREHTIPNPYAVMAIPVELDGNKIPLIVDSGSFNTSILASLVEAKPKGERTARSMDMFGEELPHGGSMRLVDLSINGKTFRSQPVVPSPTIGQNGITALGYLGMDILKDRVIYHDGTRQVFILLTRENGLKTSRWRRLKNDSLAILASQ